MSPMLAAEPVSMGLYIVPVVVGVVTGVLVTVAASLIRKVEKAGIRKSELERRAVVDEAIAASLDETRKEMLQVEKRLADQIAEAFRSIKSDIDTGNGKPIGKYVVDNQRAVEELRDLREKDHTAIVNLQKGQTR